MTSLEPEIYSIWYRFLSLAPAPIKRGLGDDEDSESVRAETHLFVVGTCIAKENIGSDKNLPAKSKNQTHMVTFKDVESSNSSKGYI